MRPENDFIEAGFQDNEERGVSNIRRVPLRGRSHVTGSTNTGATPEQREPDCGEKATNLCAFVLLNDFSGGFFLPMCGIIGYVGHQQAAPILLDGLARMEYRGYDSAGVAVRSETKELQIYKSKGRLQVLSDMIHGGADVEGTLGIGHTRWATHGEPNDINAHPHVSEDGRIALVHNGIIENYMEIKQQLLRHGVTFKSETDTEVAAQLLDSTITSVIICWRPWAVSCGGSKGPTPWASSAPTIPML